MEVVVNIRRRLQALAEAHGPGFAEPAHARVRGTPALLGVQSSDSARWLGWLGAVAAVWLGLALTYTLLPQCVRWFRRGNPRDLPSAPSHSPPALLSQTLTGTALTVHTVAFTITVSVHSARSVFASDGRNLP